MAYKRTQISGPQDAIPLILQSEATVMEPMEYEPNGPSVRFFRQVNHTARGHAVAMIAEFVGTTMFLFFSFAGAQIGNEKIDTLRPLLVQPGPSLLQISYIAAVFGVSLGVNVWVFYRVSGGMFNPAVGHTGLAPLTPYTNLNIGLSRTLDRWSIRLGPSCLRSPNAIYRRHRCCGSGVSVATRSAPGRKCSRLGCDYSTGYLPRNDPHCRAGIHHYHVGCRKKSDILYCTTSNWLGTLHSPPYW